MDMTKNITQAASSTVTLFTITSVLNLPHSGCRSQGKSRSRRCVACEDDTSLIQIFNRESFSLRGLFVGHRVRRRIVCVLFDCDMRLEDWSTFIATKRYEVPSAGSQCLINALTGEVDLIPRSVEQMSGNLLIRATAAPSTIFADAYSDG
jgi:hypothetical protein